MVQQWVKARRKSYLVVGREVSRRSDIVSCGFLKALDRTALTARVSATATPATATPGSPIRRGASPAVGVGVLLNLVQ